MPSRFLGRFRSGTKNVSQQIGKGRDVYRLARRLLREHSLAELLKRTYRVAQREGLDGIKIRVRNLHHRSTQTIPASPLPLPAGILPPPPAFIVQDRRGHYALAPKPAGYAYIEPHKPDDLESRLAQLPSTPLFSIVVPLHNTHPEWLADVLDSVHTQWYGHWQLILVDDASTAEATLEALEKIDDVRIRLIRLSKNSGISGATNAGLEVATGDFVVFLDHDDLLTTDCLYELACCIARDNPDFLYSDEDKLEASGRFVEPHFKPDWSPDTLMSTMYTCHVACVRHSLLKEIGGLRPEFDGCQDWDFVLRVTERTARIRHIPKVLYHWRILPASIAADIGAKPYVLEASHRVRAAALARRGQTGEVEALPQMPGYFRIRYALRGAPLVSIVIPTRDNLPVLKRCIDSIFSLTSYPRFEIVILDNGSAAPETLAYLDDLRTRTQISVVRHDAPFNFSELNNIGAKTAHGELLLFLNDDTEVLQADWLERLGGYAQLPHVGAVGAKLLYPGGRQVQHAGILNLEDGPGHAFLRLDPDSPGYYMRNLLEYNWIAVTGACLMMERKKFQAVGGFAECLPVAYNDIDLCLRLVDAGYFNVVVQAVRLVHHESASRGIDHIDPEKLARLRSDAARMYERNPRYFQFDPFHNPNLHPNGIHFEVPA